MQKLGNLGVQKCGCTRQSLQVIPCIPISCDTVMTHDVTLYFSRCDRLDCFSWGLQKLLLELVDMMWLQFIYGSPAYLFPQNGLKCKPFAFGDDGRSFTFDASRGPIQVLGFTVQCINTDPTLQVVLDGASLILGYFFALFALLQCGLEMVPVYPADI